MGIKTNLPLSILSYAYTNRPWQMFHVLVMVLIAHVQQLYGKNEVTESANALDSSTIDLYLSLFPWAEFREHKTATKVYTIMDLQGAIPTFIHMSDGRIHDVNILDMNPIMADSIYMMDRAYLDYERLYHLCSNGNRFVIRAKKNLRFYRMSSTLVDYSTGLQCDQTIRLTGRQSKHRYPGSLRRVRLIDSENNRDIVLLNNITDCDAEQIADYFKSLWQIELFFKWIKHNLRIKAFCGQSINAVKTQAWMAFCAYLFMVISHKTNQFIVSLHTMIQVLSVSILEHMTLKQLFYEELLTKIEPHV